MLTGLIILYLLITLAISFYMSRRIKTANDFLLAGRNLPMIVVSMMVVAIWFSPELIMGAPALFLEHGLQGIIVDLFGVLLCLLLIGFFYARKLYRLQLFTLSDFFRQRYNPTIETVSSLICVFTFFSWIAAQFLALAYLFHIITGVSTFWGLLLGATVIVAYTYLGGMWAVSVIDVLQTAVIIGGLLFVLMYLLGQTDGFLTVIQQRPNGFYNFLPQPNFYHWIDYLCLWMTYGLGAIPAQEIYQPIFSARSENAGARGIILGGVVLFFVSTLPLMIALCIAQLYPEWLVNNHGESMIPSIISQHGGLLLKVMFFGAFISAILSTASGALLASSTVIAENLIKPRFQNLSDKQLLRFTRLSVVFVAVAAVSMAHRKSSIHDLAIDSVKLLLVCLVVPLTLGLYWQKTSVFAAWAGIILGGATWLICDILGTRINPSMMGFVASFMGMVVISWLQPDKSFARFQKKISTIDK